MAGRRLGVAVVGLGRAGQFHLNSFATVPSLRKNCEVRWVIDVDADRAKSVADDWSANWSQAVSGDAGLGADVDLVVVASSTDTHYDVISRSIQSKKAVFTEKPISQKTHELQDIVDAVRASKTPFFVGFQRRADKNFRSLKSKVDAGDFGKVRLLRVCSRDPAPPPVSYLKVSGGIFHDMLCHDFDVADWFSGGEVPVQVTATGHAHDPEIAGVGDVDTAVVMMKYASGLITTIEASRLAAYGYDQRIELLGDKGMGAAENMLLDTVLTADAGGIHKAVTEHSCTERYAQAYATEMAEFVQRLLSEPTAGQLEQDEKDLARFINVDRVIRAAVASHEQGQPIDPRAI
eukprot:TRINITY_DN30487_c0_g1_i1.p2 TRINITY_DN30487_c0_g1~~TRINITY_DN30487_c0_g1_i1.p2  ORF type:complete len:348 (+),score=126.98 TRINITY_DN30487_c0_g1_i1:68-1111(+)